MAENIQENERLSLRLPADEYRIICQLARGELRTAQAQGLVLIREALVARGLLPASSPLIVLPPPTQEVDRVG